MESMPDPLQKEEDEDEEDKQFESNEPVEWIDDNIDDVWEEEDEVIIQIQSEGGETEQRSLSDAKDTLYSMFDDETVEEICEEIEDMAD